MIKYLGFITYSARFRYPCQYPYMLLRIIFIVLIFSAVLTNAQQIIRSTILPHETILYYNHSALNSMEVIGCDIDPDFKPMFNRSFFRCNKYLYNKILQNQTLASKKDMPLKKAIIRVADCYYGLSEFIQNQTKKEIFFKYNQHLDLVDSLIIDSSGYNGPFEWSFHNVWYNDSGMFYFLHIDSSGALYLGRTDTTLSQFQLTTLYHNLQNNATIRGLHMSLKNNLQFYTSIFVPENSFLLLNEINNGLIKTIDTVAKDDEISNHLNSSINEIELFGHRDSSNSTINNVLYKIWIKKLDIDRNIIAEHYLGYADLMFSFGAGVQSLIKNRNAYYLTYNKRQKQSNNELPLYTPSLMKLDTNLNVIWDIEIKSKGRFYATQVAPADCDLVAVFVSINQNTEMLLIKDLTVIDDCNKCDIKLSPNPTYGKDIVLTAHREDVLLMNSTYYDNLGRMVWSTFSDFAKNTLIDHPALASGIYHVLTQCDNGKFSRSKVLVTE